MERETKLIAEYIIKVLEERKSNQRFHRWLFPKCKQCKERDDFINRLKATQSYSQTKGENK